MFTCRDFDNTDIFIVTGEDILKGILDKFNYLDEFGWWSDNISLHFEEGKDPVILGRQVYKIGGKYMPENGLIINLDTSNIKPEVKYLVKADNSGYYDRRQMNISVSMDNYEAMLEIEQSDGSAIELTNEQATNVEINLDIINNNNLFKLDYEQLLYIKNHITENHYEYYQRLCSSIR